MNSDTLCLLVRVEGDAVISFPLYSEALKFADHGEKMIQIAARALTLNVYNVSDDVVYRFITNPPVSNYFSDLVQRLRKQCSIIDALVHSTEKTCAHDKRKELQIETDKFVDDLYYFKDIFRVGASRLSRLVSQNLLLLLVFPILLPLLGLRNSNLQGLNLSATTSIYIVCRILQVVGGKDIIDSVASVVLYTCITATSDDTNRDTPNGHTSSFLQYLDEIVLFDPESQGEENIEYNYLFGHLAKKLISDSHFISCLQDNVCTKRGGILAYIFSENHNLLMGSLHLLFIIAESKDLDSSLASMIGLSQSDEKLTYESSNSRQADECIFHEVMPQILNILLKVLARLPPYCVLMQLHTGWLLKKLLIFQRKSLNYHNFDFHIFNASYDQSCDRLQKELDGCWFDFIPDTLGNEWASCTEVLQESIQNKDPCFMLDHSKLESAPDGNTTSYSAWQRMTEAVKVFILHLQLKAFIRHIDLPVKPLPNFARSCSDSGTHVSDIISASFGSEVVLGSGVPCKIAFSNAGIRDIYLVTVAYGISGKLLLAEKHPFRSQKGIVFAIAPLAGLRPKIDENHPTWLYLHIREFNPRFDVVKNRDSQSKMTNNVAEGRFTLGFANAEACEAAQIMILKETNKQRSFVESIISPLIKNNYFDQT